MSYGRFPARVSALSLALSAIASVANAQQCLTPAAGHFASADYGVAPVAGTPADAAQVDAGFTYGRRIDATTVLGAGNLLIVDGSWHNGRLDVRGSTADDRAALRTRLGATTVTRLGRGIFACAHAGVGYAVSRSPWGPSRFIDVPVGIGFGASLGAGGMRLMPFVVPVASYWARFDREDAISGRMERADNGIAMVVSAGLALRVGRLEVRASTRNGDRRVSGAQTQVQAAVWF